MSKLGQQFSELRNSTPKYVQWLLLGAAFIVVLILLTLLMTGSKSKTPKNKVNEVPVKITLSNDNIDWANVTVGSKRTETINVRANAPAHVSMNRNKDIPGFEANTTCTDATVINAKLSCNIYLKYEPAVAMTPETVTLSVYWRAENDPESLKNAEKITVILGATAPKTVSDSKIFIEPKPVIEPELIDDDEIDDMVEYDDYIEPEPTIREEIETIAPSFSFNDNVVSKPEPTPIIERPSESCSDFAFPGYGSNGNQIGWIKPERGGYYFHPFSDKDCKNATGIYNPASGIITDIEGRGNRIGTDAEHIGYMATNSGILPTLSPSPRSSKTTSYQAVSDSAPLGGMGKVVVKSVPDVEYDTTDQYAIVSTQPYDRTFILRQYKPIPATIVSDVRADTALDRQNLRFPVRATVDRNVYSDNGRTVIIPTGTLLLGYVTGEVPGPYKAIGRMNINWYQFILPNGVEFNFENPDQDPFSADAQGRIGVPGRGSTDYLEQFVMPMLTAIVPAAVNMIAPVADKFVNQIDLDNNTVVQSGTMRSSELAKNEIITAWNQVAQKLLVDMMDNTVPPFTIPAGTRITVYSPNDLMVACTNNEKCIVREEKHRVNTARGIRAWNTSAAKDGSWVGQARSFNLEQYCTPDSNNVIKAKPYSEVSEDLQKLGYSYSTLVAYCQSSNYQAINNARQEALYQNQQDPNNKNSVASTGGKGTKEYNEQVLGLKYNEDGSIKDPYKKEATPTTMTTEPAGDVITCDGGLAPDANGCCAGEIYTDMGEQGFNCCPQTGGDCFPPIIY